MAPKVWGRTNQLELTPVVYRTVCAPGGTGCVECGEKVDLALRDPHVLKGDQLEPVQVWIAVRKVLGGLGQVVEGPHLSVSASLKDAAPG